VLRELRALAMRATLVCVSPEDRPPTEGGHFLSTVQDLMSDLCRRPILVFTQLGKGWALLSADTFGAVAMGAVLLAEEERASLLVSQCG
jgi:hypothetical protein